MGNQESTTEDEDTVSSGKNSDTLTQKASMGNEPKMSRNTLGIRIEDLTYREVNVEESDEDGRLSSFSEEDEESDGLSAIASTKGVISRLRPFSAVVSFVLTYSMNTSTLSIKLTGSTDVPGKGQGGASEYQFTVNILPDEAKEFESKLRSGPNPNFNETWDVIIPKNILLSSVLHCRLFGCAQLKKTVLLGEGFIPLEDIQLRVPNPISARLFPKVIPISMLTSNQIPQPNDWMDDTGTLPSTAATENLTTKDEQRKAYRTLQSELLLSASYSANTGKFECSVLKASGINIPYKKAETPNSFVRIQIVSEDGSILWAGKSKVFKNSHNPSFAETFIFNVHPAQISRVSLVITVYHKKGTGKKVNLGWLSLGLQNISEVQRQHWDEIISSNGDRVARWHFLVEPM